MGCDVAIPFGGVAGCAHVEGSEETPSSALMKGPVSVAIGTGQSAFQLCYSSGVPTGCCGTDLDHGVLDEGTVYGSDGKSELFEPGVIGAPPQHAPAGPLAPLDGCDGAEGSQGLGVAAQRAALAAAAASCEVAAITCGCEDSVAIAPATTSASAAPATEVPTAEMPTGGFAAPRIDEPVVRGAHASDGSGAGRAPWQAAARRRKAERLAAAYLPRPPEAYAPASTGPPAATELGFAPSAPAAAPPTAAPDVRTCLALELKKLLAGDSQAELDPRADPGAFVVAAAARCAFRRLKRLEEEAASSAASSGA